MNSLRFWGIKIIFALNQFLIMLSLYLLKKIWKIINLVSFLKKFPLFYSMTLVVITGLSLMYSCGPPLMDVQVWDDQHELTYSSYVRTRVVILKTCRRRWVIGRNGERRSGISAQTARHDDDDWMTLINMIGVSSVKEFPLFIEWPSYV